MQFSLWSPADPYSSRALFCGIFSRIVCVVGPTFSLGVILFTVIITVIYVRRANGEYDRLTAEILAEAAK